MRKLAWFTTGFAAACLLCFYCFSGQILYLVAGILFVLGIVLALVPRFTIFQRIVAAILIGAAFGMLWMQFYTQWRLDPAKKLDGTTVYDWIEITDYSFETQNGIGADGYLTYNGNRYKVRLYVQNVDHLSPGDRLYGAYLVSTTDKTDISYLQSEGITFRLFGEELYELKGADGFSLINLAATIRNHIGDALEEIFLNDTFGFAKALLLGDTSNLSYKVMWLSEIAVFATLLRCLAYISPFSFLPYMRLHIKDGYLHRLLAYLCCFFLQPLLALHRLLAELA